MSGINIFREIFCERTPHIHIPRKRQTVRERRELLQRDPARYTGSYADIFPTREIEKLSERASAIYIYVYILRERDIFERVNDCRTNI